MSEPQTAFEMPPHGSICWTELATKDSEAAKKFYTELFGWTLKEGNTGGMNYTEFSVAGKPLGGIYQMTAEMAESPSHWISYVAVDDVDSLVGRIEELGGKVIMPVTEIPHVGRFSMIQDPTGAMISVITLGGGKATE